MTFIAGTRKHDGTINIFKVNDVVDWNEAMCTVLAAVTQARVALILIICHEPITLKDAA